MNQQELKILVTGRASQGKSSLVNSILIEALSCEASAYDIQQISTISVIEHQKHICGISLCLFDSPGLPDSPEIDGKSIISQIKKNCQKVNVVLYYTRMCMHEDVLPPDKYAMKELTIQFGQKIWKHAIIVLTLNLATNDEV